MNRDIIICYDSAAGKIVCSTVGHDLTAPLVQQALPLERDVEKFRGMSPDDAEKMLGAVIFALLDLSCSPKIGIRDYAALTSEFFALATTAGKKKEALPGAEEFEQAMEKVTIGLRHKSKSEMNAAEGLLTQAASLGHLEAQQYLSDLWPPLKKRSDASYD
jgi:hypothetical protein